MRNIMVAGNWKMNKDIGESIDLATLLRPKLNGLHPRIKVVLCPPFTSLALVGNVIKGSAVSLGAQNMSEHDDGAYTGEISARMLRAVGCEYVILGHSERRQYFGESNELINLKAKKALASELKPIICVGERLEERESGITEQIVSAQVRGVLAGISSKEMERVTIAYEPVWAIGTGRNATPVQAQEVHQAIRKLIGQLYTWAVAESVVILYGGSVKADNASDLLAQSDIDGALVGGASLKVGDFTGIIEGART